MTKKAFLIAFKAELVARYPWAKDEAKLKNFMGKVAESLSGESPGWIVEGKAVEAAWSSIGGAGKPTLKKLVALPDGFSMR